MFNTWHLRKAVNVLKSGGLIAYPTEAVWGLGCDPFDPDAVSRLLALKRRPMHKGLILVASRVEQVEFLLKNLSAAQRATVVSSWPGPNTWLIPDSDQQIPVWIKGDHGSVAVRVSEHPLVAALCDLYGGPVVSTSANPSACKPALTKLRVSTYFGDRIDFILDGALGSSGKPSTIRDAITQKVIRH